MTQLPEVAEHHNSSVYPREVSAGVVILHAVDSSLISKTHVVKKQLQPKKTKRKQLNACERRMKPN